MDAEFIEDRRPDNTGLDDGPLLPKRSRDLLRNFAIRTDWETGMSLRAIGKKYGVSHDTVWRVVGYESTKKRKRKRG